MSYILDSLKKSEQKRRQQEAPGLYSEPLGGYQSRSARKRIWPWLLVAALLLNAGVLGWYLVGISGDREPAPVIVNRPIASFPPAQPAPVGPSAAPQQLPTGLSATDSTADAELSTPIAAVPGPPPEVPAQAEPAREAAPPAAAVSERPQERPVEGDSAAPPTPLDRLPAGVREQLPPLVLSLHYYAADGRSGMVRLDGRILRVGERIAEGLLVEAIVANGVVLDFRGRKLWLPRPQG